MLQTPASRVGVSEYGIERQSNPFAESDYCDVVWVVIGVLSQAGTIEQRFNQTYAGLQELWP